MKKIVIYLVLANLLFTGCKEETQDPKVLKLIQERKALFEQKKRDDALSKKAVREARLKKEAEVKAKQEAEAKAKQEAEAKAKQEEVTPQETDPEP